MLSVSAYLHPCPERGTLLTGQPLELIGAGYQKFSHPMPAPMVNLREFGRLDYQMICILKGKGEFFINGVPQTYGPGTLLFYRPDVPQHYRYSPEDNTETYWVHFSGSSPEAVLTLLGLTLPQNQGFCPIPEGFQEAHISLLERMIREIQLGRPGNGCLAALYFQEFIAHCARFLEEKKHPSPLGREEIRQMITMIHRDYQQNRTVEEYAKLCNMSTGWLITCFKKATGMTPQQYILFTRVQRARELLSQTGLTIGEISRQVGFENPFYFSRVFKKFTGVSPSRYGKEGQAAPFSL